MYKYEQMHFICDSSLDMLDKDGRIIHQPVVAFADDTFLLDQSRGIQQHSYSGYCCILMGTFMCFIQSTLLPLLASCKDLPSTLMHGRPFSTEHNLSLLNLISKLYYFNIQSYSTVFCTQLESKNTPEVFFPRTIPGVLYILQDYTQLATGT